MTPYRLLLSRVGLSQAAAHEHVVVDEDDAADPAPHQFGGPQRDHAARAGADHDDIRQILVEQELRDLVGLAPVKQRVRDIAALQYNVGVIKAFAPLPRIEDAAAPSTGYDDVRTIAWFYPKTTGDSGAGPAQENLRVLSAGSTATAPGSSLMAAATATQPGG